MSTLKLTPNRLFQGVWEAEIQQTGTGLPRVNVTHRDKPVEGIELSEGSDGKWTLRVPVPGEAIADGVQSIVVADEEDGEILGQFTLIAGDAVGEDMRVEIDLIRAELDMLKRAFRRHCLET